MACACYTWQYRNCLCLIEEVLLHSHLNIRTFEATVLLEVQVKTWVIKFVHRSDLECEEEAGLWLLLIFFSPVLHDAKINIA